MYKKILVPLDLSEYSLKALIHAEQLARLSGAELVLLHTIHYVMHKKFTKLAYIGTKNNKLYR